jgi:esterase
VDDGTALELLRDAAQLAGIETSVLLPEDRYVLLDDMRFHYLNFPGADSPVIVFLHGGALTAHTWDLVCTALRNDYRCIALDQRGHGDSDWSERMDYSREAHCRDIGAFVDALWLGSVVLVGQSMGGLNALTFAARNPSLVSALVLVDVGPEVRAEGTQRIVEFVARSTEPRPFEDFLENAVAFNPRRDRRLLRRSLLHNLKELPDGNWTWKYDTRPFRDGRAERTLQDLRAVWADVHAIACPTLVVRGSESDVVTEEQAARFAAELEYGRWETVGGAGHNVQGDNPGGLSSAIRTFLEDAGITPDPTRGRWPAA